ncbi:MAG: hypothetical protein KBD37_09535 [Burkholderiales bacterium]|nr:hypothetical protein [Burkholderiales bacterium]
MLNAVPDCNNIQQALEKIVRIAPIQESAARVQTAIDDKLGCPLSLNEFSKTIIRKLTPYFFNLEDTKMLDKYLNSSFYDANDNDDIAKSKFYEFLYTSGYLSR